MKTKFTILFFLVAFAIFAFTTPQVEATTQNLSPEGGYNRESGSCSIHRGTGDYKDCYFDVMLNPYEASIDYQAFSGRVDIRVNDTFSSPYLKYSLCLTQGGWGSGNVACYTYYDGDCNCPGQNFLGELSFAGALDSDVNYASVHVRVEDIYADVELQVWGRRAHISSFTADSNGYDANLCWNSENTFGTARVFSENTGAEVASGAPNDCRTVTVTETTSFRLEVEGAGQAGPGQSPPATVHEFVQVPRNMNGSLTANPTNCTEPCTTSLNYSTGGTATARIKKNGANWRDITSNVAGGSEGDNSLPAGRFTYSLYGYTPGWGNETFLGEATVDVAPGSGGGASSLVCNPASQTVQVNTTANFNANGGEGGNYNWSAPGGSPANGSNGIFSTTYNTTGAKTVNVSRGPENVNCTVNVTSAPVALSCSTSPNPVAIYQNTTATASGGSGSYTWSAPGGAPTNGSGGSFATNYSTGGSKTITVSSGAASANCGVTVNGAAPVDQVPVGSFDYVTCNEGVNGWAYDPNSLNVPIQIRVYRDGTAPGNFVGEYTANQPKPYLAPVTGDAGTHGFATVGPLVFDGNNHTYYVFGVNTNGSGSMTQISYSPKTVSCGSAVIMCGATYNLANSPYGVGDAARNGGGAYNPNYWLADPYQAGTTAANFDRSTNKIGLSLQGGIHYPAGLSKGLAINPPPGGKIRAINFDYNTFNYDSSIARIAIDYPGVGGFWEFIGTGNHDSRPATRTPGDNTQNLVFPGNGVDAAFLIIYQQSAYTAPTVTFGDFYINSITMDRPCNPSVTITGPASVGSGGTVNIAWTATDVTEGSVSVTNTSAINSSDGDVDNAWSGAGNFNHNPSSPSTTYTITATRADTGAALSASHTVNVSTSGKLSIECSGPAGAQWQVRTGSYGGAIANGGTAVGSPPNSSHDLVAGTYYITFTPVNGYSTPGQRTAVVNSDGFTQVGGCDYSVNQGTLNVNSFNQTSVTPLNSSWTINPGGINHTNVNTSSNSLTPASNYSVTPASLGCTYGTPATVNNITVSNAQTTNVNLNYTRGTLRIRANISSGGWSFTPCNNSGSGINEIDYPLAPGTYTITPNAVPGYSAAPFPVTISNNVVTSVVVTYTINPLEPPVINGTPNNTANCERILVSWTDQSDNENSFEVWRSTNATSGFVNVTPYPASDINSTTQAGTGTVYSYNDTPPAPNVTYYYQVASVTDQPFLRRSFSSTSSPVLNIECRPIITVAKSVQALVQGPFPPGSTQAYSPATSIIKDGDVIRFRLTISNGGNIAGALSSVSDVLSDNLFPSCRSPYTSGTAACPTGSLANPWNLRINKDNDANWNEASEVGVISGTPPNLTISPAVGVWGNVPAGGPNWLIEFDAVVVSQLPNTFETVSNNVCIAYTWTGGSDGSCDSFGPILIRTGEARVPKFREVNP